MSIVSSIDAWEILDSRGRPTIAVSLRLDDREPQTVSIPSGASTGRAEAQELRDAGKRYRGFGCRKAAANVRQIISNALIGKHFSDQEAIDFTLTQLDGTPDKSKLGANAILGTSLAFAKASAKKERLELFEYFASLTGDLAPSFPQLTINLFSGGKHAFGQVAIQDLLIVPDESLVVSDALAIAYEVYQAAALYSFTKYGSRALTADEGGLAPPFTDSDEMLEAGAKSIIEAGVTLGKEIKLAVDLAASHFLQQGMYHLDRGVFTSDQLITKIESWIRAFPIVSIEDGLAEDDWEHWPKMRKMIAGRSLTLADDLTCTNLKRIQKAIELQAADALLLKLNQVGTVSEAKEAYLLARKAGWKISVSARSGETEDNWLADLAVGWSGDFIKVGSITQSERLSKYNRLLEIEHRGLLRHTRLSINA